MTPFVEDLTRWSVILFYGVAFGMSVVAFFYTRLAARRVSTIALALIAAYWLWFYLIRANPSLSIASDIVLWSRVGHYVTACGIFTAALMVRRADIYGIEAAFHAEKKHRE